MTSESTVNSAHTWITSSAAFLQTLQQLSPHNKHCIDYHEEFLQTFVFLEAGCEMRSAGANFTANMAALVKIKLKNNDKSDKNKKYEEHCYTADRESSQSTDFEDSGVHVDEPLTPLADLDLNLTSRSHHVVVMEDLGCADLHGEEDVYPSQSEHHKLPRDLQPQKHQTMAPEPVNDFKKLVLSKSQSPCASPPPMSPREGSTSLVGSPSSPSGEGFKLKQPPAGRIHKPAPISPTEKTFEKKFIRNYSVEEVQRSLSNPCAAEDLYSEKPIDVIDENDTETSIASRPPGLITQKERDARRPRFRNILRPLRRSQSAGCSHDAPAYALFLRHELDREKKRTLSDRGPPRLSSDQLNSDPGSPDSEARKAEQKKKSFTQDVKEKLSFLRRRHTDTALASKLAHADKGSKPSTETVLSWSKSLDNLLHDKHGLDLFREFLRTEFSEENIEFWIACEEYKNIKGNQLIPQAQKIFGDFVAIQAPREINLDSKTRMIVKDAMGHPDKHTFEVAQRRIQALMERDSYPRFLNSNNYQDLLGDQRHKLKLKPTTS